MSRFQRISPCLWFDDTAEQAANAYTAIFPDSRIVATTRYDAASAAAAGRPEGSVLTVSFELDGQAVTALNGGPVFRFNEAISLVVNCRDQDEIDHYWACLSDGGDAQAQQCGWLKDRFGLSWQIVPAALHEWMRHPAVGSRVMEGILQMKKLDLAALQVAANG